MLDKREEAGGAGLGGGSARSEALWCRALTLRLRLRPFNPESEQPEPGGHAPQTSDRPGSIKGEGPPRARRAVSTRIISSPTGQKLSVSAQKRKVTRTFHFIWVKLTLLRFSAEREEKEFRSRLDPSELRPDFQIGFFCQNSLHSRPRTVRV